MNDLRESKILKFAFLFMFTVVGLPVHFHNRIEGSWFFVPILLIHAILFWYAYEKFHVYVRKEKK